MDSDCVTLTFIVPKKIWQIMHYDPEDKPAFVDDYRTQWEDMNSEYKYERLTEETEYAFIQDHFHHDSGIRKTYDLIKNDRILRADFLRYLILLTEGGVYTDVDTLPIQPIDDWIPSEYRNRTSIVLGIEIDKSQGPLWNEMPWTVQISQFTIMAKKNHPLIRRVVYEVQHGVEAFLRKQSRDTLPQLFFDDVIGLTGPRVFTTAVFEYLSDCIGLRMTGDEISGLKQPTLLADALIVPVNGFASGQQHSQSGTADDDTALVSHKWMSSWVPTHPHQQSEDSYIS